MNQTEDPVLFVGISDNAGHDMTFSILNKATNKVVNRSNVRPADEPTSPNLRIDTLTAPEVFTYRQLLSSSLEDD